MVIKELTHPVTGLKQKLPVGKTGKPMLVLSGSNQGNEASCSQLFRFNRMFQNPRFPNGHAADVGTAIHEAYQTYLIALAEGDSERVALDKATFVLMMHYPIQTDHQKNAVNRQFEHSYATLVAATKNTKFASGFENPELVYIKKKTGETIPAVEIKFEIFIKQTILKDFDVYISGALDTIMSATGGWDSEPYVSDIKTTRISTLYDETYGNANQCLPYHIVLSHVAGKPITRFTVMYHIMYIHLTDPKIMYIPFTKTQDDIDEYLKSFVMLLHKLQMQVIANHWPKNSNSCTNYNRPCKYMNVCAIERGRDAYVQDVLLGDAEPYDRYADEERKPDFELELEL